VRALVWTLEFSYPGSSLRYIAVNH